MNRHLLAEELLQEEGLRLKPYRCTAGALTVGIGRNLDARGISEAEARYMLANDIESTYHGLLQALPWMETLSDARQRVLCNMAFQMGISGLLQFRNTLETIKQGQYNRAALMMMDSRWAKQTPARAARMARLMRAG